jgi:hypothetical protein
MIGSVLDIRYSFVESRVLELGTQYTRLKFWQSELGLS